MTEENTAKGTVEQVNSWKSGKGYFLKLVNDDRDFTGFGGCQASAGQDVTIEFKQGTGNFSDKFDIIVLTMGDKITGSENPKSQPAPSAAPVTHEAGHSANLDRQESIARQCCLKVAGVVVANLANQKQEKNWDVVVQTVVDMSDVFYRRAILREDDDPSQ